MELILKSKLSKGTHEPGRSEQGLKVLLVYEDIGFINSAVELLRDAAGRIDPTGRLFCAIWDFSFFEDSLLIQIAEKEIAVADLIVIAQRCRTELPDNVKVWLNLWELMHPDRPTAMAALHDTEEGLRQTSQDILAQEVGRLGSICLLAVGGHGFAAAELKRAMQSTLAGRSHEVLDTAKDYVWLGQAARDEERLRRSRTACSGCLRSVWVYQADATRLRPLKGF